MGDCHIPIAAIFLCITNHPKTHWNETAVYWLTILCLNDLGQAQMRGVAHFCIHIYIHPANGFVNTLEWILICDILLFGDFI